MATKLESKLVSAYSCVIRDRIFIKDTVIERIPDIAVMAVVGRPSAALQIRVRRLAFFARVIRSGSASLLTLLDATMHTPGSFLQFLIGDLGWMREFAGLEATRPDPNTDVTPWISLSLSRSRRSSVARARRNSTIQFVQHAHLQYLLHSLTSSFKSVGVTAVPSCLDQYDFSSCADFFIQGTHGQSVSNGSANTTFERFLCYECGDITDFAFVGTIMDAGSMLKF